MQTIIVAHGLPHQKKDHIWLMMGVQEKIWEKSCGFWSQNFQLKSWLVDF